MTPLSMMSALIVGRNSVAITCTIVRASTISSRRRYGSRNFRSRAISIVLHGARAGCAACWGQVRSSGGRRGFRDADAVEEEGDDLRRRQRIVDDQRGGGARDGD